MPAKKHPPPDFQSWADRYVSGEVSTTDIAAGIGCAKATVLKWMDEIRVFRNRPGIQIAKKMTGKISCRAGVKLSDEARAKISAARAGVPMPHRRGEKRSDATRQKQREAWDRRLGPRPAKPAPIKLIAKPAIPRVSKPRLAKEEYQVRAKARDACKSLLRRVLVMTRIRKDCTTEKLLGYTKHQLRAHLEAQFRPGMSWVARDSFHIDHIRPVADFLRNGVTFPAAINALSNLQVLTPDENRKKSDSFADKPRHQALEIDRTGTRPMFA